MQTATMKSTQTQRRTASPTRLVCPVCGIAYAPGNTPAYLDYTCASPKCRKVYMRLFKSSRSGHKPLARCEICGHLYMKSRSNRCTCGSANCKAAHSQRLSRQHGQKRCEVDRQVTAERRAEQHYSVCEICGKSFLARNRAQVTCGAKKCQDARNRRIKAGHASAGMIQKVCEICGQVFRTPDPRRKKCGSRACHLEYMRRYYFAVTRVKNDNPEQDPDDYLYLQQPQDAAWRECLMCEKIFWSEGKQIRRCKDCQRLVEEQGW